VSVSSVALRHPRFLTQQLRKPVEPEWQATNSPSNRGSRPENEGLTKVSLVEIEKNGVELMNDGISEGRGSDWVSGLGSSEAVMK